MGIINLTLTEADEVLPCPFCGSDDIELANTHTPSYWVECLECSAEVHGQYFEEAFNFDPDGGHLLSHEKAKASALKAWNRRA